MALAPYKEGQGIWIRGVMATTIFVVALYAGFRLYDWLYAADPDSWLSILNRKWPVPVIGWVLDLRLVPVGLLMIGFLGFGVWAYNHPKFVDFLIDTENEVKSRVTWPTRKELFNASTVVVITVILIAVWVLLCDLVFTESIRRGLYRMF